MQTKICGICSVEDARAADRAGADYIGVILSPRFRRSMTLKQAMPIMEVVDDAQRVGVFVDASVEEILNARRRLSLDVIQLHGSESPEMVRELRAQAGSTVWKVLRPRGATELRDALKSYGDVAHGVLVEGWSDAAVGGTGAAADDALITDIRRQLAAGVTFILAGGLDPANVTRAIEIAAPDIVDVSSGVESEIGIKSAEKIEAFISAARAAGQR